MNTNPYEVLHLEEDASYEDIKERYRHLTRYLHPDKQPLQNYQITKKLFEQIDEAYKSIASPLRRFLFREYGLTALKILDDFPNEFKKYECEHLTPAQTKNLRQLMIYLLYEREAGVEMERSKFNSKTLLNISKLMGRKTHSKLQSKRNLSFPEVQNSSFEYEMVLPDGYGFSNSVALSQSGTNLRSDPRHSLSAAVSSVRRLQTNYMLIVQSSVSSDDSSLEVGIDRICENNLHLKLTPFSMNNFVLGRPKFAVEKAYGQSQFSAITDLGSSSFEFSDSTPGKTSRSLRLFLEPGNLGFIPKIEWQMAPHLRFFVQVTSSLNFQGEEGSLSMQQSLSYGYKLALSEDLKLQLTSSLGHPNYFQMAITNSKFRAAIPFATSEGTTGQFELCKLAAMLVTYFCFQAYHWRQKRDLALREQLLQDEQNRFSEQRRELQRHLSYAETSAGVKREKEIRYNGLIVLRAYLGEKTQIRAIRRAIAKARLPSQIATSVETVANLEHQISQLGLVRENFASEVCEVTMLLQSEVNGAQLTGYDVGKLQQFNPSLTDSVLPWLHILCVERGQLKTQMVECKGKLWLGGGQPQAKVSRLLRRALHKLSGLFRGE